MRYFIFNDNQILVVVVNGDSFKIPSSNDLNSALDKRLLQEQHKHNQDIIATVNDSTPIEQSKLLKFISIRQAFNYFEYSTIASIAYNKQLLSYYNTHQFCGTCGKKTRKQLGTKFVKCTNCDIEIYPHIAPSIMVRIHKDNQILMARSPHFPPQSWGLIAGFVEVGESLEEAVHREVMEEIGIKITNLKYWGSQPWPFPTNSLMVAYTAQYLSGDLLLDPIEIESAGFFDANNLPGKPSNNYSIAFRMIEEFLKLYSSDKS